MQVAVAAGLCLLFWGLAIFVMKLAGARLDPLTTVAYNALDYLLISLFVVPKVSLALTPAHAMGWRDDLRKALKELKAEERQLERELARVRYTANDLRRQLAGTDASASLGMSQEERTKISAGQKKRWQKQRESEES